MPARRRNFARLHELNAAYRERFGFPFILAVRGHNPRSIIAAFEQRIANDVAQERAVALQQIGLIGGLSPDRSGERTAWR